MSGSDCKKELRREVRKLLASIPDDERIERSSLLLSIADSIPDGCVVALFASLPDEPSTIPLIDALSSRCHVVLPRIADNAMEFFPYSKGAMQCGAYNIMEPVAASPVPPSMIDIMLVPGVAFTVDGKRMGRGKGFYDRYMSRQGFRAKTTGICFKEQIVEQLPVEQHDVSMNSIFAV